MKRNLWMAFVGLCVLTGSAWLLTPVADWVRGLVYLAVGIAAVALNGRSRWSTWSDILRLALAAVLLLGVPETMAGWAVGYVPGSLWTVTLSLVPAMVVLVVANRNDGEEGARRLLLPALAAFGGGLLLIPVGLPRSSMGLLGLGVLVLSTVSVAIAGVAVHGMAQRFALGQAVAVFCLANSMVLLVAGTFRGWSRLGFDGGSWVAMLVTGVEVVLLVWVLQVVEPIVLSARFLVVPLVAIVEGYVLLRPGLTARMGFGAALLLGGAVMLFMRRDSNGDAMVSLH